MQEDQEFRASLSYRTLYEKKNHKNKRVISTCES